MHTIITYRMILTTRSRNFEGGIPRRRFAPTDDERHISSPINQTRLRRYWKVIGLYSVNRDRVSGAHYTRSVDKFSKPAGHVNETWCDTRKYKRIIGGTLNDFMRLMTTLNVRLYYVHQQVLASIFRSPFMATMNLENLPQYLIIYYVIHRHNLPIYQPKIKNSM